jgi:DNA modification methylase
MDPKDPPEWNDWTEAQLIHRQKELAGTDAFEKAVERGQILHRLRLTPADYKRKNIGVTARLGQMLVNFATSPRTFMDWEKPAKWTAAYPLVQYDARDARYSGVTAYHYAVSERIFDALTRPNKEGFKLVGHESTRRNVKDAIRLCRSRLLQASIEKQSATVVTLPPSWANQIVYGDCLQVIRKLPPRSINAFVMSPPYADQMKEFYPGKPAHEYVEWFCAVMAAIYPVLADDGTVTVVIRAHEEKGWVSPYVLDLRRQLRNIGWGERQEWKWIKPDGGAGQGANEKLRHNFEDILLFAKLGQEKIYINATAGGRPTPRKGMTGTNPNGVIHDVSRELKSGIARRPDVFTCCVGGRKSSGHPAPFPVKLCKEIIETVTRPGDIVCDPFMGGGTTAIAARSLGRNYFGIDVMQQYVDLANRRLANESFTG